MRTVRKLWMADLVDDCPTSKKLEPTREMTSLESAESSWGPTALSSRLEPRNPECTESKEAWSQGCGGSKDSRR